MIANPKGSEQPVGHRARSSSRNGCPTTTSPRVRNTDYWRKGLPYLDSITYRPITDAQQRANALQAGNIDIMHTDLPESILQFKDDTTYGFVDDTSTSWASPT